MRSSGCTPGWARQTARLQVDTAPADASPVTGSTYTSSGWASGSTLHAGSSATAHSAAAAATRSGREAPAPRREGKDDDLTG